jgi:hypothetical protein
MVSPKPLSDFVSDVTLIAFPIPVTTPAWGSASSLRESQPFRVKEFVDFEVKTKPGANPNSP